MVQKFVAEMDIKFDKEAKNCPLNCPRMKRKVEPEQENLLLLRWKLHLSTK